MSRQNRILIAVVVVAVLVGAMAIVQSVAQADEMPVYVAAHLAACEGQHPAMSCAMDVVSPLVEVGP